MNQTVTGLARKAFRPQLLALLVAFVLCIVNLGDDLEPVMLLVGIWGIAGVGLGLVLGFAGQISLCQAAFVGVGAYSYAILTTEAELAPVAAAGAAVVIAAALAALLSPILRIRGYYLAIATIVLNLLLSALAISAIGVPGGSSGMAGVPYLDLFGFTLDTVRAYAVLGLVLLLAVILGAQFRYGRGRRWRAIQALRHDEDLASGVGLNVVGIKRELFTVSGAMGGLAGVVLAAAFGFVSPGQFSYAESFTLALAVFIGGSYSLWGAALGVALLEVSAPLLGDYHALHGMLVGVVALLTVRFAPEGWVRRRDVTAVLSPDQIDALKATAEEHRPTGDECCDGYQLSITDLGRTFGSLKAVSGVTVDVEPGTVVGLIGPNGAGKSTLLNLIAGEIKPTTGTVAIDGGDITGRAPYKLARVGVVRTYQQSRIITGLSVLDNILLGTDSTLASKTAMSTEERRAAAVQAAVDAGAERLLSKETNTLTFGERRLVELARLLVSNPRLALLDEPLSGLSHREGEALASVITTLRERGTTVVLVEHAIPFVLSLADQLVVLRSGQLLASGDPETVIGLESVRDSYLGSVLEDAS